MRELAQAVNAVQPAMWRASLPKVACNDCRGMSLELRRRESGAAVQTYTLSWNDAVSKSVPAALLRLHDSVYTAVSPSSK
jgi:hypothetical protein